MADRTIMNFALCEQQHFLIAKTTVNTKHKRRSWDVGMEKKTEQGKEILMIIFMHVIAAKKGS